MAQIVKPISTITIDSWQGTTDGINFGTDLHTYIDEFIASADDNGSYILISAFDPGTYTCEVKFDSLIDPAIHTGHTLRFRTIRGGFSNQTINISLYQGTTLIYSSAITATASYATSTFTLSEAQAANITDYTDLRVRISHAYDLSSSPRVSTVEFEVPDAGGGGGGVVDTTTPGAFVLFL